MIVAALSPRSSVSANHAPATTTAVRIPPREYVSSNATIQPYASRVPWSPLRQSASGSAKAPRTASWFHSPTGALNRVSPGGP